MVPHLLQDRRDRLITAHQIGEFVQHYHRAARQLDERSQGGLPGREGKTLRDDRKSAFSGQKVRDQNS